MADARQTIMTSPAGWREALVFADLGQVEIDLIQMKGHQS
jgi:hypothetical protein